MLTVKQSQKKFSQTASRLTTALLLAGGLFSHSLCMAAGEVEMFKQAPSASEMANIMFPGTSAAKKPRFKTRSIRFSEPSQPETVTQMQQEVEAPKGIGFPVQFGYNSTEIQPDSRPFLDEFGKMLNMDNLRDKHILIEGHTDASGSQRYNKHLSRQRANAVKQYLTQSYNVDPERLVVSGKGEQAPLPDTDPYDAQNRRVQFFPAP